MNVELPFKDYLMALKPQSNEPLTLDTVLRPFGLSSADRAVSRTLLVGHILDHLLDDVECDGVVDAIDVTRAAFELGHAEAESFLDQAPWLMFQLSRLEA